MSWFTDVRAWDEATGVDASLTLRVEVMREEWQELQDALAADDRIEIADACADLIWTVLGLANHYGFPFNDVFAEISRSNWSKLDEHGNVVRREDGKILKPSGFSPPNLDSIVRCRAHIDGDCYWKRCPQIRDGEPKKTGRHCPLDRIDPEE